MQEYFASAPMGLVDVLEKEILALDLHVTKKNPRGVYFEANLKGSYRANIFLRTANRIMRPIATFSAYQPEELYGQIKKYDFTRWIGPDQTMAVDCKITDCQLRDQRFVALKTKDAIADQFTEKYEKRPDVEKEMPDLGVLVRGYKNQFDVMVDTSGGALFMRGYRRQAGLAPLKESLAAALLLLSDWDQKSPLVDLMTGSGTLAIEAALMASKIAPGTLRKSFSFMKHLHFDEKAFDEVMTEAIEQEIEEPDLKIYGFDIDSEIIRYAKDNAKNAGVAHLIEFKRANITELKRPCEMGTAIVNPPYGTRLGDEDNLRDVYRDLGHTLKTEFQDWTCWALAGNRDLLQDLKLKSDINFPVYNGPLECRFLKYKIKKT